MRNRTSGRSEGATAKSRTSGKRALASPLGSLRPGRWAALALMVVALAVPSGAAGYYDQPNGGGSATGRTATELEQRLEAPARLSTGNGFSWADAAVGAGVAAGLAALVGVALAVRRRSHASAGLAV